MTHLPLVLDILIGLLGGGLTGALHFRSLEGNLRLFLAGRALAAIALQLLRIMLSVVVLVLLLNIFGLPALLAGAAALLLVRQWVIRRQQKAIAASSGGASS